MEAKEKAEELFNEFSNVALLDSYEAKLCTLLLVDEMINEFYTHPIAKVYWKKVKQEIELL